MNFFFYKESKFKRKKKIFFFGGGGGGGGGGRTRVSELFLQRLQIKKNIFSFLFGGLWEGGRGLVGGWRK